MSNKEITPHALPAIGANLKRERRRQELSLEALSLASSVSKAMLSQIESGKVNPTVVTLWKIANALKVEFELLLTGAGERTRRFEIRRANQRTTLPTAEPGVVFTVLSPITTAEDLELYLLELAPGSANRSQAHAPHTEEYLTVLSGQVTLTAGTKTATLQTGDTAFYQADIEHSLENPGQEPARIHMTVRFAAH